MRRSSVTASSRPVKETGWNERNGMRLGLSRANWMTRPTCSLLMPLISVMTGTMSVRVHGSFHLDRAISEFNIGALRSPGTGGYGLGLEWAGHFLPNKANKSFVFNTFMPFPQSRPGVGRSPLRRFLPGGFLEREILDTSALLNTRRARGEAGRGLQIAQVVQELGSFLGGLPCE